MKGRCDCETFFKSGNVNIYTKRSLAGPVKKRSLCKLQNKIRLER